VKGWKIIQDSVKLANAGNSVLMIRDNTRGDRVIWSVVAVLVVMSLLAVYSSTGTLAYKLNKGNTAYYLVRQILFITTGVAIIYFTHLLDYRWFSRVAVWLYLASIVLLLYTLAFGANYNEASRWIKLPVVNLTFQTSDFARLALFMYLARQLSRKQAVITQFRKGYIKLLFPILLTSALIAPANLSTALLTCCTGMLVLFLGRASLKHLLLTGALAATPVVLLIVFALSSHQPAGADPAAANSSASYQIKQTGRIGTWVRRIQDFAYAKKEQGSFQIRQAKIAITNGGWLGKGPGNSEQRNYLPHPYSDFIFAIIIEEYGIVGAAVIMLLYLAFLYRSIRLFRQCPYAFGAFLALALSITLTIQASANMAVNVNLLPTTGVTLPLVSMGGTSFLFTCFAIGIILSVSRNVEALEGKQKDTADLASPQYAATT
jgi:cell division protein FtsW